MDRPLFLPRQRHRPQPKGPERWGTPMPLLHESIADIAEKDLIARVLTDPHYRQTLLNIKGITAKDATVLQNVELRDFRADVTGDVDILVIPPNHPEEATAIQVKRFKAKVGPNDANLGHVSRMAELFEKGVKQANDNAQLGFSQVYLWVFIAIDTREQNSGRLTYDGADSQLTARLHASITTSHLEARVGLMDFEWVQPMDRPPFELGSHGTHLQRLASSVQQPAELTGWIRTLGRRNVVTR